MIRDVLESTRQRIALALPERDRRARARVLDHLSLRTLAATDGLLETTPALVTALLRTAAESRSALLELEQTKQSFVAACAAAKTPDRLRGVLLSFLEHHESAGVDHVKDRAALRRWLDQDALIDRIAVRMADLVDEIEVAYVAATELSRSLRGREVMALQAEALLELAFQMVETRGAEILRVAPLRFTGALIRCYEPSERFIVLGLARHRAVKELASNGLLDCWSRIAAFEILGASAPDDCLALINAQLMEQGGRDGMVVRNNLLRLVGELAIGTPGKLRVLWQAQDDPSEHVRQGLARQLGTLTGRASARRMAKLVVSDPSPRVRAFAMRELSRRAMGDFEAARVFLEVLSEAAPRLATEPGAVSVIEIRVLFNELRHQLSARGGAVDPHEVVKLLQPVLTSGLLSLDFLEEAAFIIIQAEVCASPRLLELRNLLHDEIRNLAEGQEREVQLLAHVTLRELERALLAAARGGLPVAVTHHRGDTCRLTKGERRATMAWRVLNELRTPAPDKREAFSHTTGRYDIAEIVVPPYQMGEVTPTRVPGERRQIEAIRSWGVFLPRVDDFLAALRIRSGRRRVVTSFGTVVVIAPQSRWGRTRARVRMILHYARLARLREVALAGGTPKERRQFANAMRELGFCLDWEHQKGSVADSAPYEVATPAVARYFGLAFLPELPSWVDEILNETLRSTGNTAWHLALVVWLMLSYMVLRGAWIRARTERARARIPITVGGWGSRGKSGSERIKAALFHALRYDTVVKTTGCEAMFIHARRDQPAREIYIYRPYGKATIWEQGKLLSYADELNAQVFLWECMALRPQFVELLEHEWMKDDVTTLTNAYPDHEDVMGPSGEDVARVIGSFGSRRGIVFTAEQELLPIIEEVGRSHQSTVHAVSEIDAELLPRDLLDRFPYAEHPRNIALILAMAEHFGIDREWALVKMADHTVPDLGVLKTYPTIGYRRRLLTFSNGMSANERAGFMSNWRRLGYDRIDMDASPESVIVAVVNNRADRVPRSRVFAELLTRDVACDLICVIGSNVAGMGSFIEESLDEWLESVGLGDGSRDEAHAMLEGHCARVRVLRQHATLTARISLVLGASGLDGAQQEKYVTALAAATATASDRDPLLAEVATEIAASAPRELEGALGPDDFVDAIRQLIAAYMEACEQRGRILEQIDAGQQAEAEKSMRAWFRQVFLRRVQLVMNYYATGDQVIDLFTRRVPPGHHARVLGCQNIKGTGLDFAYRWVSVGQVDAALTRLETDPTTRGESIGWLASHADWGLLDALDAVRRLTVLRESGSPEWVPDRAQIEMLLQNAQQILDRKLSRLAKAPKQSWVQKLLGRIEPFVDHLDAIRRQRRATRIMRELFALRVSQGRAALLLREVTDRGQGGWLAQDFDRWLRRRTAWFGRSAPVHRDARRAVDGEQHARSSIANPLSSLGNGTVVPSASSSSAGAKNQEPAPL